jgi:hypothetical protein
MSHVFCKIHPDVQPICPACAGAAGGAAGKGVTSKAKARSSANNGFLGGHPPLPKHADDCPLYERQTATAKKLTRGCPRCDYERAKRLAVRQ